MDGRVAGVDSYVLWMCDTEARVVQCVYEMYTVAGLSIGEIARRLNAEGSGDWADHGERAGGLGWRREELRQRTTDGGVVGAGSRTALERRQTDAPGNQVSVSWRPY